MKPSIEALCHVIQINRRLRIAAKVLSWLLIIGIISAGILIEINERREINSLRKSNHVKEITIARQQSMIIKQRNLINRLYDWKHVAKDHPEQAHKKILIDKRMRLIE